MSFNVLAGVRIYGQKWEVVEEQRFSENDLQNIESARVVDSQYGSSCCLFLKGGHTAFIPMATDSKLKVGETVDVTKAKVLILSKPGEANIMRLIEE